jgi:taurine dioxygenase
MKVLPNIIKNTGVEIDGVALQTLSEANVRAIREEFVYRHRFVLFRNQALSAGEYLAFAQKLGTPQVYPQDNYHHPAHPEIFISSNLAVNGRKLGVARTGYYWHTDCSFQAAPLPLTMLYPQILPSSRRETMFIDMSDVLTRLPAALRERVERRVAWHGGNGRYKIREEDVGRPLHEVLATERQIAPPVSHPVVIRHGRTGEGVLYVNEGFTMRLEGLSPEESAATLAEVFAFIARPEHVITHEWRPGDVIFWDNRSLVHRSGASPADEPQLIYRIGVYDGHPFYAPPPSGGAS